METDAIVDQLESLGAEYELIECDPELADTAEFCAAYGYEMAESANLIVVVGKSEPKVYAACLVLATTRLNVNGTVKRKFGVRKASFAPGEQTAQMTGMTIGGVTPFGLPAGLPLWIDARVMALPKVIIGGGSRSRKLCLAPSVIAALDHAEIVEDLAHEIA